MAKSNDLHATIEHTEHPKEEGNSFISPDGTLILLTWITFFLLLVVLKKFAWKPILDILDQREEKIQKSLDDAERIKQEMEKLQETTQSMLDDANTQAVQIVKDARKAAQEAAKVIESKARDESKILVENAQREIKEEQEKAQAQLREESAKIAVDLASKILEENLDNEKNKKLVNRIIKDI